MATEIGKITITEEEGKIQVNIEYLPEECYPAVLQTLKNANEENFVHSLFLVMSGLVKETEISGEES